MSRALFGTDPRVLLATNALNFASPTPPTASSLRALAPLPTRCTYSDSVRKSINVGYIVCPADTLVFVTDIVGPPPTRSTTPTGSPPSGSTLPTGSPLTRSVLPTGSPPRHRQSPPPCRRRSPPPAPCAPTPRSSSCCWCMRARRSRGGIRRAVEWRQLCLAMVVVGR